MQQSLSLISDRNSGLTVPVYVVTSQANLRDSLAMGFIGPRNAFYRNYTADFLELSSGRVPLFSGAITGDMLEYVRRHHPPSTIPVLLEVNLGPEELHGIPLLEQTASDGAMRLCYAYSRIISLTKLRAIHFISDDELMEFRARVFRDLPDYVGLMRSSPELVHQSGPDILEMTTWLSGLEPLGKPEAASFIAHDRVAGAYILARPYTRPLEENALLQLVTRNSAPTPMLPSWLGKGIYPEDQPLTLTEDENCVLFAACVRVLHNTEPGIITGQPLLDRIEAEFTGEFVQDTATVEILKKARLYLRNEEGFRPLKNSRHVVAAALLLFLMKPDPERLLNWPQLETGATEAVMQTAMVFAGLLRGRKSLDVKLRPAEIDNVVSERVISSLNKEAEEAAHSTAFPADSDSMLPQGEIHKPGNTPVETTEDQADFGDKREHVLSVSAPKANTEHALKALPVGKRKKTLEKEASPAGRARSEAEELRSLLISADFNLAEFREAALAVCLKMNWHDCVRSTVVVSIDEISTLAPAMRGRSKVLTLTMPGIAVVEYELLDQQFRECMLSVKPNDRRWLLAVAGLKTSLTVQLTASIDVSARDDVRTELT